MNGQNWKLAAGITSYIFRTSWPRSDCGIGGWGYYAQPPRYRAKANRPAPFLARARSTGRGSRAGVVVSFGESFVGGVPQLRKADPVTGRLFASHTNVWMVGFIGYF